MCYHGVQRWVAARWTCVPEVVSWRLVSEDVTEEELYICGPKGDCVVRRVLSRENWFIGKTLKDLSDPGKGSPNRLLP